MIAPSKCAHCRKTGTLVDPITDDPDGNWLCEACHLLEEEAQADEATY